MSVEFIGGKPGAGKSLLSVTFVIEELVYGRRIVVTNLPLKLDALNEYLQKKYPDANVDLSKRVRLLNEDEFAEFFRYRENGVALEIEKDEKGKPIRCDYSKISKDDVGVFYVLDELHIAFNARAWMTTGAAAIYYLSQHRKLGDDVFCITQSTANVDKQFRSVAQEFHQVRNLSKERWGYLRGPQKFQVKTYLQQPTTTGEAAIRTTHFTMPMEVAKCYDTAAGVGIVGRSGADKGTKKKGGLPFWTIWAAFGLVAVVVVVGPYVLIKGGHKWAMSKGSLPAVMGVKGVESGTAAAVAPSRNADVSDASEFAIARVPLDGVKPATDSDLYVTGILIRGQKVNVVLSDGRIFTEKTGELDTVERGMVTLKTGQKLWLRTLPRRAGAGGESPPGRQRAEAAAAAIAEPSGRDATVGENVEVEGAPAPLPDSTPMASVPVSRGQTFRQSPRTAAPVINERKSLTPARGVTKSSSLGR